MNSSLRTTGLAAFLVVLGMAQQPEARTESDAAPIQARQESPLLADTGDQYILDLGDGIQREALSAYRFVGACQEVTGVNFTWRDELTADLQSRSIRLLGTKALPKDRFYAFFELMMSANGFEVELIGEPDISVVQITAARGH